MPETPSTPPTPVSTPEVTSPTPGVTTPTMAQVTDTVNQAVGAVGQQLTTISQAVGTQEMIAEASDWLVPMKDFVMHTLAVAFFINPEQRITRGEYVIGSLAVMILVGFLSGILAIVLGGWGISLGFLLMTIPLFNLAVKRFHDMNKPGRWSVSLLIPVLGLIMPVFFKGVNENNPYGPDPIAHVPNDDKGYIIIALSLFIISSLITSILSFIGISMSKPSVDPTDPTMMGDNNLVGTQTNNLGQRAVNTTQPLNP